MCYNWLGSVSKHWRQRSNQRLPYKLVDIILLEGSYLKSFQLFDQMIWLYYFDIACLQKDLSQDDECLLIEPEVQGSSQLDNGLFKLFQVHVANAKIV